MKEWGGYLPIELPKRQEYFSDIKEENLLRLNCGRSTFYCAVKDAGVKKVYMPYLNCANSIDPILSAGAEVEYYYLNEDLTPKDISPKGNEAVLWVNYYGNAGREQIEKVYQQYPILLIDNCHAFYSKPLDGAYNCYSTRKFFGVADGAYLIKTGLKEVPQMEDSLSAEEMLFLLKTIEQGTNTFYQDNLIHESRLADRVAKMSKLTRRILSSIDYQEIQDIRYRNILRLHENLKDINQFQVNLQSKTQLYYPLLVFQDSLRQRLVSSQIYTPTWWRHVEEQSNHGPVETKLSKYMLMIPIDQRYTEQDMDELSEIIRSKLE